METDTRRARVTAILDASARQDFATATERVMDLFTENPDCSDTYRAWGRVLRDKGQIVDAVEAFRKAVMLDPGEATLHFELASALVAEGQAAPFRLIPTWIDARDAAIEGVHLDPHNVAGRALLEQIEASRPTALG